MEHTMSKLNRLLIVLPVVVAACSGDSVPLDERTETSVGAAGGQALSAAGDLSLNVEAGTLADNSVVTDPDRPQSDRPDPGEPGLRSYGRPAGGDLLAAHRNAHRGQ